MLSYSCLNSCIPPTFWLNVELKIHTHTHTHIYLWEYGHMCVCEYIYSHHGMSMLRISLENSLKQVLAGGCLFWDYFKLHGLGPGRMKHGWREANLKMHY